MTTSKSQSKSQPSDSGNNSTALAAVFSGKLALSSTEKNGYIVAGNFFFIGAVPSDANPRCLVENMDQKISISELVKIVCGTVTEPLIVEQLNASGNYNYSHKKWQNACVADYTSLPAELEAYKNSNVLILDSLKLLGFYDLALNHVGILDKTAESEVLDTTVLDAFNALTKECKEVLALRRNRFHANFRLDTF
jgi:hypothetical protein